MRRWNIFYYYGVLLSFIEIQSQINLSSSVSGSLIANDRLNVADFSLETDSDFRDGAALKKLKKKKKNFFQYDTPITSNEIKSFQDGPSEKKNGTENGRREEFIRSSYGKPCKKDFAGNLSLSCNLNFEICVKDIHEELTCKCDLRKSSFEYMNGRPICFKTSTLGETCDCPAGAVCINFPTCVRRCINESHIMSDGICLYTHIMKYQEECKIDNTTIQLCDERNNFMCINGSCQCRKNYSYDFRTSHCKNNEANQDEGIFRTATSRFGEPCGSTTRFDCISGLVCSFSGRCACPRQCRYNPLKFACDCGLVEVVRPPDSKTPVMAIILGIIGTVVGVVFCIFCVSYRRQQRKTETYLASRDFQELADNATVIAHLPEARRNHNSSGSSRPSDPSDPANAIADIEDYSRHPAYHRPATSTAVPNPQSFGPNPTAPPSSLLSFNPNDGIRSAPLLDDDPPSYDAVMSGQLDVKK